MGFHQRKLLQLHNPSYATMAVGRNCSPAPSPLHSQLNPLRSFLPSLTVDGNHFPSDSDQNHVILVGMIAIACTFGLVVFLITIFKILANYHSRRQNLSRSNLPILFDVHGDISFTDDDDDDRQAIYHPIWFINTVGLQQSVIDSITVCKYRKDDGLIDGTECSVCLSEFREEESLRLLPKCSHAFHIPCIDTWLRSHKNCPLCRAPIVSEAAGTIAVSEGNVVEPSFNFSGASQNTQMENLEYDRMEEGGSSGVRIGDDDSDSGMFQIDDRKEIQDPEKNLTNSGIRMDSTLIRQQKVEEEIQQQPVRRSVSMGSPVSAMIYRALVVLNSEIENPDSHLDDKKNSSSKIIDAIVKQRSASSPTSFSGSSLKKRPISMKRSFSRNRKLQLPRHCRSQSSTLPL
ncbi:hypothetical protein L6164_025183 [Bauhinia variegata]|uniref:Uncharacterized protein n=1 Tax=Bauhinia variegata TaxID=167791 RepID=A0ACB9M051_BAUVA|nr:hypothetical protein L6164_025183 [Bauhinia variegata]